MFALCPPGEGAARGGRAAACGAPAPGGAAQAARAGATARARGGGSAQLGAQGRSRLLTARLAPATTAAAGLARQRGGALTQRLR